MKPTTAGQHLSRFGALALSVFLIASAASAQDTATAPEAPSGAEAQQPGQPYFKEQIGDWRIRCVTPPVEGQTEICQLFQLLGDANNNPVAEFTILPAPDSEDGSVLATVVTPLETLLTPGVRLSVDESPEQVIPFSWCTNVGCYARFVLAPADVEAFQAGIEAKLSITPLASPNQRVELTSSLRGFTLALQSIQQ